jgi:hypothetical protein
MANISIDRDISTLLNLASRDYLFGCMMPVMTRPFCSNDFFKEGNKKVNHYFIKHYLKYLYIVMIIHFLIWAEACASQYENTKIMGENLWPA